MSQKLKSTAPWLILPCVVVAFALLGFFPPSQQVHAQNSGGVQTDTDTSADNPTPEQCCACFEEDFRISTKDSSGALNEVKKASDDPCYKIQEDKNNHLKFTVTVDKKNPLPEGCDNAVPTVKVKNAKDEIVSIKTGFVTEHDFERKKEDKKYRVEVWCSNSKVSDEGPCSIKCIECDCGCEEGDCESGACEDEITSGSARVSFSLGTAWQGDSKGLRIEYYTDVIINPGVSALTLRAPNDGGVITTRNGQGHISTVKTGNIHAAVVSTPTAIDPKAFEIRKSTDLTNPVTAANAFRTTRVENTAADKLLVTTIFNGSTTKTEYTYTQATDTWTRVEGITAAVPNGLQKEDLTINDDGAIRTERRTVTDIPSNEVISDTETTYTYLPWGREMTKRVTDPDGAALTTTWGYYEPGEQTGINGGVLGYGRLQTLTRYDGYEETHLYDLNQHTILRPFAGNDGALVETRSYHSQSKTFTVTRQVGQNLLSKTVTIEQSPTVTKSRVYTDSNNYLETTTEYYPSGQDFGGQTKKITRPDGTVTIYEYARGGDTKTVTMYEGVPGGANITEGTKKVSTLNQSGKTISSITTAVGTGGGSILAHEIATAEDDFGRIISIGYFPDGSGGYAYTTGAVYGCCGVQEVTDKTGVTTYYAYDALQRRIKTNRLGITTETKRAGLTAHTYRYPEAAATATVASVLSGGDANEISRTSRNLANTQRKQWGRNATGANYLVADETVTDITYKPAAGLSMRTVMTVPQTVDDAAAPTQTTETYLDGKTYQTFGDLSPAMRYSYAVGVTGAETSRSYVDGANLRETVTTRMDLASRSVAMLYADGVIATTHYNALGQMVKATDPDGVISLFVYNAEGQRTITALDLNTNGVIDYDIDQISSTESDPATAHGETVIRTIAKAWQPGDTGATGGTVTSYSDRAVTGLKSWSTTFPLLANPDERTGESVTTLQGGGNVLVKNIAPDNSYALQTTTSGLIAKTESFDAADNLISSTTYQTYDAHNRPIHVKDSRHIQAAVTTYVNGVTDIVSSITDAAGNTTAFTYDKRSRRITLDAPDTIDAAGATLANITTTRYFAHGQTKETTGAQTYRRTYTYDYAYRMKTLTTYGGTTATTEWVYSTDRGFLTEKSYHGETGNGPGNTADYAYTPAGRLATRTWERGVSTTYHFDAAGRQTKVTYSDTTPQVDYIYDRLSRPHFVIQGPQLTGSTVNVTEYTYRTDNFTLDKEITVEGAYDANANNTQYTSSQAFKRTLDRSVDSRLRSTGWTIDTTEHSVSYAYHANDNRLNSVTGNGQTHTYGYQSNSYGLLATITGPVHTVTNSYEVNRNILTNKENKAGVNIRSNYLYVTNAIGQRTDLTTTGTAFGTAPIYQWKYNAAGELVQADDSSALNNDRAYQFDGIGNRKKTVNGLLGSLPSTDNYTSNALNQYTAIGSLNPVYDNDGNMTSGPLPAHTGVNSTLAWDAENRLASVTVNGTTTTYGYDFQSRRIRKTTGGFITRYLYDGWNPVAEYAGTTLTKGYTWGMDLSGSMQGAGGVGGLLSVELHTGADAGIYHPTFDGNGNVSEYLDSNGAVAAHYEYDAFGNITVATGAKKDSFAHLFSTKYTDSETGLLYYGYRYYDSAVGRFVNRDPIEEQGGLNLYGFIGNQPIGAVDYLGLEFYHATAPAPDELGENFADSTSGEGHSDGVDAAASSKKKATEYITMLTQMSDEEYNRITQNGKTVIWYNHIQQTKEGPSDVDLQRIAVNVSRQELIGWLRHEQGSQAEIFKGAPKDVLNRATQRGNEELSKNYKWTSFAFTIHGNGETALFSDGSRYAFGNITKAINKVHARTSTFISCGSNAQRKCEIPVFKAVNLLIDREKCTLEFTPAQVVEGRAIKVVGEPEE